MTYALIFVAFILAGVIWLLESGKSAGEDKAKREILEEAADDIYTAKKARERYDADPDYAKRMRDKYRK